MQNPHLLKWPGSKRLGKKTILPLLPYDVTEIVSPFLGGGAFEVEMAERGVEVFAYDTDVCLVAYWRVLLDDARAFEKRLEKWTYTRFSKEAFTRAASDCREYAESHTRAPYLVRTHKGVRPIKQKITDEELDIAEKFWLTNRYGYGGGTPLGHNSYFERAGYPTGLKPILDAMAGFTAPKMFVEVQDWRDTLAEHTDQFLFVDPPYYQTKEFNRTYADSLSVDDHEDLAGILKSRKSWILCLNNCQEVLDLYAGHHVIEMPITYTMDRNTRHYGVELVILSADLEPAGTQSSLFD